MKRSPKLHPTRWDALAAAGILLLAAVCWYAVWGRAADSDVLTAVVSVDGVETERFPLTEAGTHRYSGGGYTIFLVSAEQDGVPGLQVTEADCPTQDCVHTGRITRAGQSIVCLPARIVIRLAGGASEEAAVDVVIG